jgi:tetratricopeptide (TPR) repeat protein
MDKLISQILAYFEDSSPEKGILYYYLAESNFKLKKYPRALEMIQKAIKLKSPDKIELRDWRI